MLEVFGCYPEELVDQSVRGLLQFLPKKKDPKTLTSQPSEGRFSRTEMWRDLMNDLTSVRVVNGKHKVSSFTLFFGFFFFFFLFVYRTVL